MKKERKSKNDKRKLLATILAALLIFALVVSMAAPLLAAEASDSPARGIEISGELGFANRYKVGYSTPIKIHLTNSGEAFKGFLQVKVNVSSDKRYKRNYIYSYPVELPQGSSKRVELEAPIQTVKSYQQIVLVDEGGREAASKLLYCSAIDPTNILVGVFADDKNSLNYLRQLKLNMTAVNPYNMTLGDRMVFFDENNFPASEASLKSFNIILINDYDTSKIKQKDMDTLVSWVKSGGIVVIGTGTSYGKTFKGMDTRLITVAETGTKSETLAGLADELKEADGERDGEKAAEKNKADENKAVTNETEANKSEENKTEATGDNSILLSELTINGEAPKGGETTFTTTVNLGLGAVIIHNFDLGVEPAPSSEIIAEHLTKEYTNLLGARINYSQRDYNYDANYHLLQNLPSLNNISLLIMFIIIFAYIIIIGPVLYFILKKKDMREKGFVIIPVLALVTLSVLYMLGVNAMYKKPIVNTITKINLGNDENFGSAVSNYGVFSPRSGTVDIELENGASPAITSQEYYYPYYSYSGYVEYETDVAEIRYSEKPRVLFFDKASWASNTFRVEETVDFKGGLLCDFTMGDGKLNGTVVNNTGFDLEDVVVGIGFELERYDFLKNGDKLEISQTIDLSNQSSNHDTKVSKFYQDALNPNSELSFEEKRKAYYKQSILQNALQGFYEMPMRAMSSSYAYATPSFAVSSPATHVISMGGMSSQNSVGQNRDIIINVYGFGYDSIGGQKIIVNGIQPNEFHTNFFSMETKYDYTKDESFDLPFGVLGVSHINSEAGFDMGGINEIYLRKAGTVEFVFNVSTDVKLGLFQIKWSALVKKEIYNEKTSAWEELKSDEYGSNANDYINENGNITIRGEELKEGAIALPSIRIKSSGI